MSERAEKDLMEEKDMSNQKKILHDDSNGLDYVLVGDYYLPMIDLPGKRTPER